MTQSLGGLLLGAAALLTAVFTYIVGKRKTGAEIHHIEVTSNDIVINNLNHEVKRLAGRERELSEKLEVSEAAHHACENKHRKLERSYEMIVKVLGEHGINIPVQ